LMAQRDLAIAGVRRAMDLSGDLLALGTPSSARPERVIVPAVLEWVVRLLEPTARRRGVTFAIGSDRAAPAVRADPERLKQVLMNLVLNAIEASPAGQEVRLDVRAAAHRARRAAVIEVRDR